jgi:3-phenylpropionate/trans-cinnamate dioxygenase ferredoxin reductase component
MGYSFPMAEEIVVIGGGLAAGRLAAAYREAGGEADVTIVSSEPDPPYNRPPLTKGFLRGELDRDATLVKPPEYWDDAVVELRLETTVETIDAQGRELQLEGGERLGYTTLVIATGTRARTLPIPGSDRVGVHTYRTLVDAETVRRAAEEAHSAIVIGGSFIGSETAASLRMRGLDVTLVEVGPTLMPQLRAPELSAELVELYRAEGVDVLLETEVEELMGNGKLLTGARTKDGQTHEAYLAIVGVGVVPNVELAEEAGAKVDNGIVVDERFETSLPGVYAIGDVARFPEPVSGRMRRIEHWSNAAAQGDHLGRQLAGAKDRYDEVPVFFTQLFTHKLQVIGDVEQAAECVLRGSIAEGKLIGFHLTEKRELVGAVVHGQSADITVELGELLRRKPVVDDVARLADESLRPAEAVVA